jgi:hypothetical protein
MSTAIICFAAFAIGVVLGVAAEWKLLRPWVKLALRQAEVLHGPGLVRTSFQPYDGDDAERARVGRQS